MGTKLYVGNLPYSATEQSLETFFAQAGSVSSARVITDRETGRSKGFAFVEMASEEEANNAINQLNGQELDGRALRIAEAKPQENNRDRGDRGGRSGAGRFGGRGGSGGGRGGFRRNHDDDGGGNY